MNLLFCRVAMATFLLLYFAPSATAHESKYKKHGQIEAVLGEAENQGYEGMLAVACGINNRPEGLTGVFGRRPYDFSKDTSKQALRAVWQAYAYPEKCWTLIKGADMWENVKAFGQPAWEGAPMVYIVTIGDHNFYRRLKNE